MAHIGFFARRVTGLSFSVFLWMTALVFSASASSPLDATPESHISSASAVTSSTRVLSSTSEIDDEINSIFNAALLNYSPTDRQSTVGDLASDETLAADESVSRSIGQMLISLAVVILFGLAIAWFFKRFVLKDAVLGGGYIRHHASYSLSQKSKVHLLQVGERFYLVGEGNNSLNLISEIQNPVETFEETPLPQQPAQPSVSASAGRTPAGNTSASFGEKLSQWQASLQSKDMQNEVRTSLLLLGGLAQRLRNKQRSGDENA